MHRPRSSATRPPSLTSTTRPPWSTSTTRPPRSTPPAAPVINGAAYGPLKGVQTLTLSQIEDSPQKTYVEIQQKDAGGTWRKHTGEWFFATNTFAFSINTEALDDGPDTHLEGEHMGRHRQPRQSATFPVTIDRVKPIATLVTPTSSAPQANSTLNIELDASDDHGLQRLTANIYQGGTLLRSTSSSANGATHASHRAAVTLPEWSTPSGTTRPIWPATSPAPASAPWRSTRPHR